MISEMSSFEVLNFDGHHVLKVIQTNAVYFVGLSYHGSFTVSSHLSVVVYNEQLLIASFLYRQHNSRLPSQSTIPTSLLLCNRSWP